jgi:hypothetical protein
MDVYLETRGSARSTGYRYLGAGPAQSWWRHRYGRRTAFEYPTILVEHDADGWRAYLSGMLSSRSEPGGSTNRVTLVIESTEPAGGDERELVLRLVAAWVQDTAADASRLQEALDDVVTEEVVTRLYAACGPGEVQALVEKVGAELGPVDLGGADPGPSWIAPVRSAAGRAAFLRRVDALIGGATGAAVLVNLVDDGESYARRESEPETAVLVLDPDGRLPDEPAPLAKKDHRPPAPAPPSGRLHRIPVLLVLSLLVLAGIWWVLGQPGT